MQKTRLVQNITSIIADDVQFFFLWCCAPPGFVIPINSLVLLAAVIHKRRWKKLISKTIKHNLDSSSKIEFAFFMVKKFKKIFGKLSILSKIWK